MFIQTETTPNPNALKFFPGTQVLASGAVEISNPQEAKKYKIAESLFEISDIKIIMLSEDFISVTKSHEAEWEILKPQIFSVIVDYFTSGLVVEEAEVEEDCETTDETGALIKDLIAQKVRPAVMEDGGNVVFKGYKDGIVYLKLQGACSGCPSASLTLKDGIENMLQYYVPEVKGVEQV